MLYGLARGCVHASRELGFDPKGVINAKLLPRFVRDLLAWRREGGRVTRLDPVLRDRDDFAGVSMGAYFHQDLLVAQRIFAASPRRHIDVGSRIDGFVAHLAVFRQVEVLDLRPLRTSVTNIKFTQADVMSLPLELKGAADSVSCLHALEHFGLGRYGDPIDPAGHMKGFASIVDMLVPGGTLYLSFPIGVPAVEFNAQRIFHVDDVFSWPGASRLQLLAFAFVDSAGELHVDVPTSAWEKHSRRLTHGCGIYTFRLVG